MERKFAPGPANRNRIKHRLFSFISRYWRGKPLYSLATIISLIGSTATKTGLIVYCDPDTNDYPTGIKISQSEMDTLDIRRDDVHGDWIYTFLPALGRASVLCDKP